MDISLNWLNRYLEPGDVDADEADRVLTAAGFPIEARQDLPGDVRLDVEITSNRGDCLSHLGLAREIAAVTGRTLRPPAFDDPPAHEPVGRFLTLRNTTPEVCPLFTARLIRGIRVGPSPAWLVDLLESVGQRSINTVVDVTNFLTIELGNPCHVFDLARLAGPSLVIRWAKPDEALTTLDGKARTLRPDELVVADADRAQSLAGVIGGRDAEVTEATTDVVLEMATWDPVTVRRAARRHAIRTDASHRFERIVDPRTIDLASRRAAAMIVELAGGHEGGLCEGVLVEGRDLPETLAVSMRPSRCNAIVGVPTPGDEMVRVLDRLGLGVEQTAGDELTCRIPPHRPDLTREIDLIEEVARITGMDRIPTHDRLSVVVPHPQESERAMREVGVLLTGLGFYETTTFSFVTPERARMFLEPGLEILAVDAERRREAPTLRPSLLPSLLACRKANQDASVSIPGGVRLFETAGVFAQDSAGQTVEQRRLGLFMDVPAQGTKVSDEDRQHAVRLLRGVIEALARTMGGPAARIRLVPTEPRTRAYDPAACARVELRGSDVGRIGLICADMLREFDLSHPVVAGEVALDPFVEMFPPGSRAHALPAHPGIERDLSLVVDESVAWERIARLVRDRRLELCEGLEFVGTYRGRQIGRGRKSVTMRLRFCAPDRTLRHEEVDPQISNLIEAAASELGAKVRA